MTNVFSIRSGRELTHEEIGEIPQNSNDEFLKILVVYDMNEKTYTLYTSYLLKESGYVEESVQYHNSNNGLYANITQFKTNVALNDFCRTIKSQEVGLEKQLCFDDSVLIKKGYIPTFDEINM